MTPPKRLAAGLGAGLMVMAGCGADGNEPSGEGTLSGELTVFAAASLTDAFEEIANELEAVHPDLEVVFNFAGSQTLASQINEDAPAGVFASANTTQMDVVAEAGVLEGEPELFASNLLAIAVEPGNPFGIEDLADLADHELLLVLPAEGVPAGQYAHEALDAAGVSVTPASLEQDVRAALSKVALGEADAAIVYMSDIATAGDRVEGVDIPEGDNIPAAYPIAALRNAPDPAAAEAFVAYVTGQEGQRVLEEHGFSAP